MINKKNIIEHRRSGNRRPSENTDDAKSRNYAIDKSIWNISVLHL